jgi:hypothetical protein
MPTASKKLSLPLVPHPDHLRKQAKALLAGMRTRSPTARLSDAQQLLANEYGFPNWNALQAAVAGRLKEPRQFHASIRPIAISILERREPITFSDPENERDAPMRLFPARLGAQVCIAVVALVAWAAASLPVLSPHGAVLMPRTALVSKSAPFQRSARTPAQLWPAEQGLSEVTVQIF